MNLSVLKSIFNAESTCENTVENCYIENPNKDPNDLYNNGCKSHYEMRFEYENPKNQKNHRLRKNSFYNSSSPFALFLCNWDDVWEREESNDEDL